MRTKTPYSYVRKSFNFEIQSVTKSAESGECVITGYANTSTKDRVGDVVIPTAFEKTLPTYLKNPVLLFNHDWSDVAGRVQEATVTDKGLFIKARVSDTRADLKTLVKEGAVSTFSIGYNEVDTDYDNATKTKIIKELELLEISIVTVPANTEASFTQVETKVEEPKAVEPKAASKSDDRLDSINELISAAHEAGIDKLSVTDVQAIIEHVKSNEDVMNRKELVETIMKSLAPAVKTVEAKADVVAAPAAEPAKPADAPKAEDDSAMKEVVARLDAMAAALSKVVEMLGEDAASDAAEGEGSQSSLESAVVPGDAAKASGEKCDKCGAMSAPVDAAAKEEKSLEEMSDEEYEREMQLLDSEIQKELDKEK